jgi:hypothetical protein
MLSIEQIYDPERLGRPVLSPEPPPVARAQGTLPIEKRSINADLLVNVDVK